MDSRYVVRRRRDTRPIDCPCGSAWRILTGADNDLVSIHRVTISREAQKHYHTKQTEFYIILSGSGELELDEERLPVEPGDVIMIPPYTQHVARGDLEIINIVCPPFDPEDEYLVETRQGG